MLRYKLLVSLLLVSLVVVSVAGAQIVDYCNMTASAPAGVLFACPQGDGTTLASAGLTITVTVIDNVNLPIVGIPATDIWLIGCNGLLGSTFTRETHLKRSRCACVRGAHRSSSPQKFATPKWPRQWRGIASTSLPVEGALRTICIRVGDGSAARSEGGEQGKPDSACDRGASERRSTSEPRGGFQLQTWP